MTSLCKQPAEDTISAKNKNKQKKQHVASHLKDFSKIYVTVKKKKKKNSLQMSSESPLDLKLSVRGTGD